MKHFATATCLLLLTAMPVFAQDEDATEPDQQLMVDPAFSDDPKAVVPFEPSAAERQKAADAARGPDAAQAKGAELRGLDKITGKTQDFKLQTGESLSFGRLQVSLAECRYPAADPSSDAFAELTIVDTRDNQRVFSGWMLASSPALSALDDPRYDVWVISCSNA